MLNPLVQALVAPPVPAVQAWGRAYDGRAGPPIDLSQAVPGYPPHPDMLRWLGEAAADPAYAGYGAIEGEDALRAAYAAHIAEIYGAPLDAGNVHVTSGCNEAFVTVAMALAQAGDRLLLANPFYFNHETSLAMLGVETRLVDCRPANGFLPDPGDIARALDRNDVRALALVSPNNPTGAVYPAELLSEIFRLCRDRGVWLIVDETYRDFRAEETGPHRLFDESEWQETLVSLTSFSKSYCIPGHRLGAVTAGPGVVEAVSKIMDNVQICPPRAAQGALARAIPALGPWREANRLEIGDRAKAFRAAFDGLKGFEIAAMGAYFAYVRHPFAEEGSAAIAERLAKQAGIVTIPGEFFGPGQERYLRFAFANADVARIALVRERLERALPRS